MCRRALRRCHNTPIDDQYPEIREVVKTALNLEMAATAEMQEIALALHPDAVTLVLEKREEVTTEGGLDLKAAFNADKGKTRLLVIVSPT